MSTTSQLTVLVVDDNADAAETMGMLIEQWGHLPIVATSGDSALSATSNIVIDVALLDICMPSISGFEVARNLQENGSIRRPLLIAITGRCDAETRERALDAGFEEVFVKPVDLSVLQNRLDRYARIAARPRAD